jgi:IS30 family transposase
MRGRRSRFVMPNLAGRARQPPHGDLGGRKQAFRPGDGQDHRGHLSLLLRARHSVTFDCGSKFVTWPHPQAQAGARSCLCDPQSPHQKGAVESTSRRARRRLPREADLRKRTGADIRPITDRMNATPRKRLGGKTPAELFAETMVEPTGRQSYPSGG